MNTSPISIFQRLWYYCNILCIDGMSYNDCAAQLTYLLFLRMDEDCVQELEQTNDANLKRAGRLRQAILKRAFEGRLVRRSARQMP
jgi:hypothetical protein